MFFIIVLLLLFQSVARQPDAQVLNPTLLHKSLI